MRIVTCRDVKKGEQLNYDYACTETESSMHYGMKCLCRTPACRGTLTFTEWRSRAFIKKNRGHVNEYVWKKHAENSWYDPRAEVRVKGPGAKGMFARIQKDAMIKKGDIVIVFSGKIVHRDQMYETGAISKRDFEMSLQVAPALWQIPAWKVRIKRRFSFLCKHIKSIYIYICSPTSLHLCMCSFTTQHDTYIDHHLYTYI
jgi:hypothetical protein